MSNVDWDVDPLLRVEVEHLIFEHMWRLDHGQQDTLWELCAEDIELHGPMGVTHGVEGMKKWGAERVKFTDLVGKHYASGIRVAWVDGVLTSWTPYVTYRNTSENPLVPASVGEFIETYSRIDGKLRFQSRRTEIVFGGENAAAHAARIRERRGEE